MSALFSVGIFMIAIGACGAVFGMCLDIAREQRAPVLIRIVFGIMAAGMLAVIVSGIASIEWGGAS